MISQIENDPEMMKHYFSDGLFSAIYSPRVIDDLSLHNKLQIGNRLIVKANVVKSPIIATKYQGQYRFNSSSIRGWFPEEDISELQIIKHGNGIPRKQTDGFCSHKGDLEIKDVSKEFLYRMYYTTQEQIDENFGISSYKPLFVVGREYTFENDDYVKSISKPPATYCEKAVWSGEKYSEIVWKKLYGDKSLTEKWTSKKQSKTKTSSQKKKLST